jgi:predicted short-subunit dehydrogenase-like oxidoreductase (DUF2520 family)
MKISIIGAGRLGGALAIALSAKDFEIENLFVRNLEGAEQTGELFESPPKILAANDFSGISSEVVFITTQDSEIKTVARQLAEQLKNKPQVFHTSGSLSSEILQDLKITGCRIGSIHPLVSISDAHLGAKRFAGAYFCLEGDTEAIITAKQIVERLGGKSFSVATKYKALYHASAVMASGHLTALIDAAIETLTHCELDETNAQKILMPLVKSTAENLELQTTAEALTGTFARADVGTLEKHLAVLRETSSSEVLEIYLELGLRSLLLAEARGASSENLEKMRGHILLAKKNLR